MSAIKNIMYYILVIFLVIYVSILAFSPDRMIEFIGFRAFIVLSNSMEPTINIEDMVICKRVDEEDLDIGDVITFNVYIPEMDSLVYVTHYIGNIEESDGVKIYYTRGEQQAENTYDEWKDKDGNPVDITFDDIEGRYFFKIPYIGHVKNALTEPVILTLVILNGGVIYILVKYIRRKGK